MSIVSDLAGERVQPGGQPGESERVKGRACHPPDAGSRRERRAAQDLSGVLPPLPHPEPLVGDPMKEPVEFGRVEAGKHEVEVLTVAPVLLFPPRASPTFPPRPPRT